MYPSNNGVGTAFILRSNEGSDSSSIGLYRTIDQTMPIIIQGKAGYSSTTAITEPT